MSHSVASHLLLLALWLLLRKLSRVNLTLVGHERRRIHHGIGVGYLLSESCCIIVADRFVGPTAHGAGASEGSIRRQRQ